MSKTKARVLIYGLLAFAALAVWRLGSMRAYETGWPDVLSVLPDSFWPGGRTNESIVASKYFTFAAVACCLLLVAVIALLAIRRPGQRSSRNE